MIQKWMGMASSHQNFMAQARLANPVYRWSLPFIVFLSTEASLQCNSVCARACSLKHIIILPAIRLQEGSIGRGIMAGWEGQTEGETGRPDGKNSKTIHEYLTLGWKSSNGQERMGKGRCRNRLQMSLSLIDTWWGTPSENAHIRLPKHYVTQLLMRCAWTYGYWKEKTPRWGSLPWGPHSCSSPNTREGHGCQWKPPKETVPFQSCGGESGTGRLPTGTGLTLHLISDNSLG